MRSALHLLHVLDGRIAARAGATRAEHPWWPCADGCDHCCRSLARLPEITRAEWERLSPAIDALSDRDVVRARIRAAPRSGPVTCPMLDREHGSCRVYDARPIACRTYGFYTERDGGLHCHLVTRAIEGHDDVVWGNGEAVARDLDALGEKQTLDRWLDEP